MSPQVIEGADLRHVDAWLFDLDDTLYPHDNGIMVEMRARIARFIARVTGKPEREAAIIQRGWLEKHGAALPGMLAEHNVDPKHFLEDIHNVSLDALSPHPALDTALAALPGRCFIFTNGAASHAERVLTTLGVAERFEGVFHIESADMTPKPHPSTFDRMIAAFGIAPEATCFFEDTSKNLIQAKALEMTTVLVGRGDAAEPHIDYLTDDLIDFLTTARVKEPA